MKKMIILLIIVVAVLIVGAAILFNLPRKTFDAVINFAAGGSCQAHGGKMLKDGYNEFGYLYKCVIPYRDGGRVCHQSSDCSGHCVVSSPDLPEVDEAYGDHLGPLAQCVKLEKGYDCAAIKPTGECQKLELTNCQYGWELNGGKITSFSADCVVG